MSGEPPHQKTDRPRGFALGIAVGVAAAAIAVALVLWLGDDDLGSGTEPSPMSPTPTASDPTATPSDSPDPSPSPTVPPRQRPEVRIAFSVQDWAKGERLLFYAYPFRLPDSDCEVHVYSAGGRTRGAMRSGCSSWERTGYDVLVFRVVLRNVDDRATSFNLRNFVLSARDGRSFGPVNVRSEAETPPNFLPETARIPPRSNLLGYLTFDGRAPGLVPARLSYVDGRQTLTVVFDGRHSIR
jgi:hypothetical protein